jgi:Ribosome biogenesis regulatory protein (RRS1)
VELDLGNLLAFDPSAPATRDEAEAKAQATALMQALMNALLQLPSESTPVGRVAALPPPSTPLPRAKPLPKPREPTKWEKFAQQKGIVKRKRSALVFDEAEQGFKRRYGYQRANEGPPILEAKAGDEVGVITEPDDVVVLTMCWRCRLTFSCQMPSIAPSTHIPAAVLMSSMHGHCRWVLTPLRRRRRRSGSG